MFVFLTVFVLFLVIVFVLVSSYKKTLETNSEFGLGKFFKSGGFITFLCGSLLFLGFVLLPFSCAPFWENPSGGIGTIIGSVIALVLGWIFISFLFGGIFNLITFGLMPALAGLAGMCFATWLIYTDLIAEGGHKYFTKHLFVASSKAKCKVENEGEWCVGKHKLKYEGMGKVVGALVYGRIETGFFEDDIDPEPVIKMWNIWDKDKNYVYFENRRNVDIYLNDKGLPEMEMIHGNICFPPQTKKGFRDLVRRNKERGSSGILIVMSCLHKRTFQRVGISLPDSKIEELREL